ncbi:MAG: hypothetical protein GY795_23440 [Desulfobacterales bacterium]|nr:hypothetical protein [Desulfobacterales bacterium]
MKIMENDMNVADHSLHPFESDYHSFFSAFPVSIIFHLIVAAALIFGQDFLPEKKITLPPVIDVSIVSLPPEPETTVQNAVFKAEEKVAEPETVEPEPEEPVAEPEEPEEKMAEPEIPEEKPREPEKPKEKTPEPEKPEKKMKHKTPDPRVANSKKKVKKSYKDTIELLKQKYKGKEEDDVKIEESGQGFGIPTEAGDPDAVIGRRDYGAIRFYRDNVIPERINKNWAFSDSLTTRRFNLEAVLVIKIMPDGEITDILFKKRSGDHYFDDSAYKAVVKSSPLPPLPKGYDYYKVGLKFTPTGMN